MLKLQGAQEKVIGIEIGSSLVSHTFDFGESDLGLNRRHHAFRNAILQIENVVDLALKAVCPEVRARRCVNQLCREPEALAGPPDTTLEHIAGAQVASDISNIDRPAFVGER